MKRFRLFNGWALATIMLLMTACSGDGGSASSAAREELGRCEFTMAKNGQPRVNVWFSTKNKQLQNAMRTDCARARAAMASLRSCDVVASNAMMPIVSLTPRRGYVIINKTGAPKAHPVGTADQLARDVRDAVIFNWMAAKGMNTFTGCGKTD